MSITDDKIRWLYENRSERMDPTVPIFDSERAEFHLDRYRFAAKYVELLSVADIACGTGYGVRLLVEQGKAKKVIGVDQCREAIEYAEARHSLKENTFICADAAFTELKDASVDCVVSFETIELVADDRSLIDEFARILKPEGLLICSTPNQWRSEIAPHHVRVYNRHSFQTMLQKDLTFCKCGTRIPEPVFKIIASNRVASFKQMTRMQKWPNALSQSAS